MPAAAENSTITAGRLAAPITGLLDNSNLRDTLSANSAAMKNAADVATANKAILDPI
ncbi:hypothetical protein LJR098_004111 [Rhizobium sp. LjRoot98]